MDKLIDIFRATKMSDQRWFRNGDTYKAFKKIEIYGDTDSREESKHCLRSIHYRLLLAFLAMVFLSLLTAQKAISEPIPFLAEEFPTIESTPPSDCSSNPDSTTCRARIIEVCDSISIIDLETGAVTFEDPCPINDCAGIPDGDAVVDQCGVCNGDGTSCLDCLGTVNGTAVVDQCGVCGGDGTSCLDCLGNPNGGAVVDQCGICAGDGRSCLDCAGEPNGDTTLDACGECGGTATSADECQNECVWLASWATWSGGRRIDSLEIDNDRFEYTENEEFPSCFYQRFRNACRLSRGGGVWIKESEHIQYGGWCRDVTATTLADFIGVPANKRAGVFRSGLATHYFMNSDCKYVEAEEGVELCGYAGVSYSPVSLLWEENVSLESDMRVVSFSINPERPDDYTLWKASAKAPLLIFDPKTEGTVSSAKQLFGNYTFGGRIENLSDHDLNNVGKPWENGYQAMAILDSNKDEKLSGSELDALALWFDENRNAVVDTGEIRSLLDAGVISLFFKNTQQSDTSKDISIEIGYERLVDGKIIRGRSVDWFAETFASKQEASEALRSLSTNSTEVPLQLSEKSLSLTEQLIPQKEVDQSENPLNFAPPRDVNHKTNISGFWIWHLQEKGSDKRPGVFALKHSESSKDVSGYNVVESQLENNRHQLSSNVNITAITGAASRNERGELEFTMETQLGDSTAKSIARLSEDGSKLYGKTIQIYAAEEGNMSATVDYEWVARKVLN